MDEAIFSDDDDDDGDSARNNEIDGNADGVLKNAANGSE